MTDLTKPSVALEDVKATLAAEIAVNLLPMDEILRRNGVTKAQVQALLKDPGFANMVRQFRREWHEASNAKERIRLKAALAVEDGLLELNRIYYDIENNPSARIDAFKQLVQLADVMPKATQAEGSRFTLNIQLGQESKAITIDGVQDDGLSTGTE